MASSDPELRTPRAREIVDVALELLEQEGPDGLSMRRLADRLGIRAPSIYKHLPDKRALEAAIISV
jgi:AcrR family transcriptional regulator